MKELVKGFVKWVIIVFVTLDIIVWSVVLCHCQHPKHPSNEDFEDTMGFITVTFMSQDDRLIYWKRETRNEVRLSSFGYDKYTKVEEKLEGKLCIVYCKTHMFAYIVTKCSK